MKTILASEICSLLENNEMLYISTDNCYSSTIYKKVGDFLDWLNYYQANRDKIVFKVETFKKNYFVVQNNISASIDSKNCN